jgi:murein DD-endopeptidase MepM/ murein hydrolase activator NlpD
MALVLSAALLYGCVRSGPPAPVEVHGAQRVHGPQRHEQAGAAIGSPTRETQPGVAVVQAGDTLYGISRRHNIPVRAVIDANRLEPPYIVQPGQRLVLPRVRTHVVQSGDTVYAVSRRYGVEVSSLVRANAIEPPYTIQVGQTLILPGPAAGPVETAPVIAQRAAPAERSEERLVTRRTVESAPLAAPARAEGDPQRMAASSARNVEPKNAEAPSRPEPVAVAPQAATRPQTTPAQQPAAEPDSTGPDRSPNRRAPVAEKPSEPVTEVATALPARGARAFLWPLRGRIVSDYGPKGGGLHNDGINIAAPQGTSVRAAENGVVVYAGNELRGFGNLLLVRHADGWVTAYAHLDEKLVERGDRVRRGQVIGRVGATGNVNAPQLHFEIRRGTRAVNPREHLGAETASAQP